MNQKKELKEIIEEITKERKYQNIIKENEKHYRIINKKNTEMFQIIKTNYYQIKNNNKDDSFNYVIIYTSNDTNYINKYKEELNNTSPEEKIKTKELFNELPEYTNVTTIKIINITTESEAKELIEGIINYCNMK